MRYVTARKKEQMREEAYRIYVTRSLQLIPQNQHIVKAYDEIIRPVETDNRSGDEIAADIIERAGLKL